MQIEVLDDGSEVLVSDVPFETLTLTSEVGGKVLLYAVVLTDEMKKTIKNN